MLFKNSKLILFCLGRTGSTSLQKILNCHRSIKLEFEPFNSETGLRVKSLYDIQQLLNSYYYPSCYDYLRSTVFPVREILGIKHVFHPCGWPFEDGSTFNCDLLSLFSYRIILRRRNSLKRLISHYTADQTRIWHPKTSNDRNAMKSFEYKPIPISILKDEIENENAFTKHILSELTKRNENSFLEIFYEDVFEQDDLSSAHDHLSKILRFLKLRPFNKQEIANVNAIFVETNNKSVTDEVYERIPNFEEIKNEFKKYYQLSST